MGYASAQTRPLSLEYYGCMASHGSRTVAEDPQWRSDYYYVRTPSTPYSVFVPMHDAIARYCLHDLCAPCVNHRTTEP